MRGRVEEEDDDVPRSLTKTHSGHDLLVNVEALDEPVLGEW